jgi:tRNA-dihydrouridine synthase
MQIKNKAFLAPLSEYTTAPFRMLCKRHGADITIVPLVSATAIARRPAYVDRIDFSDKIDDCIQLFGKVPDDFSTAVDTLKEKFPKLKWIDINCGCPSYIVQEAGAGSALLDKPQIVARTIELLRNKIPILSVKMRLAGTWEKTSAFAEEVANAGIDFLTVHGRTSKQGYSGKADWDKIREIKGIVDIPVIGNGDLQCRSDGEAKVKSGHCDAFMIGRAAMGNPRCFENGTTSGKDDAIEVMKEYMGICGELECAHISDMQVKALQMMRNFSGSAKLRGEIGKCKSVGQLETLLGI